MKHKKINQAPIFSLGNYHFSHRNSDESNHIIQKQQATPLIFSLIHFWVGLLVFLSLAKVFIYLWDAPIALTIVLVVFYVAVTSNLGAFLASFKLTAINPAHQPKSDFGYRHQLALVLLALALFAQYLFYINATPALLFGVVGVLVLLALVYYYQILFHLLYVKS